MIQLPNPNAKRRTKGLMRLRLAGVRIRSAAVALAGALSLMVAGLMAVPVQAQTGEILVKNFDKAKDTTSGSGLFVGSLLGRNFAGAQEFTTGSSPAGYTITEVTAIFNQFVDNTSGVKVSIYTSTASGIPDSSLYELTNPMSIDDDGWNRFTPPENSTTLDSSTTYLVVFDYTGSTQYGLVATSSSSEDSGGAAGWGIGNENLKRTDGSWAGHVGGPLYLRIKGTVHNNLPDFGAMTTMRDVEAETPANVNVGAPVTATDHDDEAPTYTLGGADTDTFAIDSSTGQIRTRVALPNQRRRYSVTVTADDGNGGTDTIAVTINLFVDDQVQVTNLEARARAGRVIALSWDAPPNSEELDITGYRIEVSTDGTHFEELVSSQDATQYVHNTGFPAGQTLYYRVRTILESLGPRPSVAVVSATTEGDPRVAPSLPALNLVEGGSATYTVALTEQPSSAIRVTHSSDNSDVKVSPPSLTFRPDNWEVPQSVTVQAAQDADDVDDVATVTYSAAGSSYQPSQVRVRVKDNDRPSFGTLEAEFYYTFHLGTVPGVHFGESLEVRVRFSNPLRYRHDITDVTGPNGEVFVQPGPELTDLIGPDRGIRVTNGTVESIGILDHRILVLNVTPSGSGDITLTLEPLPCDEPGALCSGSAGLADRVQHTVRAAADPPPTPTDIQQQRMQQGNTEKMRVSFDGTDDATISRVQWKFPGQEWSEAKEFWTWRRAGPEERQRAVTTTVTRGVAYDIRARWESPIGIGPWAYGSREGLPQAQWGETLIWRLVGGRAEVRIHYDRDLDRKSRLDVARSLFDVTYSESRAFGHSVEHVSIIDNDQGQPRVVKLRLASVVLGRQASGADGPHVGERVWVSYERSRSISPQPPGVFDRHGNAAPSFGRLEATLVADLNSPALYVADATVSEAQGATADFAVTLSRAASETVTVEYAAVPDGSATEGADYAATSGTLTFNAGETSKTISVPVHDDSHEDGGETFRLMLSNPSGGNAYLADAWAIGTIHNDDSVPETSEAPALTASFPDVPQTHDGSAFTFELAFTMEVSIGYETLLGTVGRPGAISVTGGRVTAVSRVVQEKNQNWHVTVEPNGDTDVTISLPATTDCAAAGAICTADARALAAAVTATVAATVPAGAPYRVRLAQVPDEHDGTTAVTLQVLFNKEPKAGFSSATMRDSTLKVRQGGESLTASKAERLNRPHNDEWRITIDPVSKEDLTVTVGPVSSCSATGAVCTGTGEAFSNTASATIPGPPGLSVADAQAYEAAGATVDFAVTLGRASGETVTVDYATSDGTAVAGSDYTETSGTLSFAAGETAKTVPVPVLDDGHDEDEETFTLTLSNPSGANAWLKDATATGTIENTDAMMPRAWLARFGRTVAEQVLDAIEGRLRAAPRPGIEMRVAGQAVGGGALDPEDEAGSRLVAMSQWLQGETGADGRRAGFGSRTLTERDLLTGSSFAVTGEANASGLFSLWGRGALSRFDGRDGDLSLDGEVTSGMVGADWTGDPGSGSGAGVWTAGLLVSHLRGTGSYRGKGEGKVSSTLTGVWPYGRYAVSDRVTLWGSAGYGMGTLTLTPKKPAEGEYDRPIEAGMDLMMGAVGIRGTVVEMPAGGGPELAVKSDAIAVRTLSEKAPGLAAAKADVTRVRLGLEGMWRVIDAGGGQLVPRLEVGVRHDGGDAETGFGLVVGGGFSWSHPASGISAEVSGRGLLTHEAGGFRERGLSGSLAWSSGQGSGRGPKLKLTQAMGASASGGVDALLGRGTLAGLAANDTGDELENRRLELRLGYGFSAFGDRFTSTPELGLGLSNTGRDYSLGWRLNLAQRGPTAFDLTIEATRREHANDGSEAGGGPEAEHGIGLQVTARW